MRQGGAAKEKEWKNLEKKELIKLAAQRQRDAFEKSLSMNRAEFEGLFEFLG